MTRNRTGARVGVAIAALALSLAACARTFHGVVTHVTDGDSLWVRTAPGLEARQVRVQGIDAPEICQPYGREARAALAALTLHREVLVTTRARDRYERILARVSVASGDVGGWMVAHGHAWSDGWRGNGGPYARQQEYAMRNALGLWGAVAPVPPREFRRHGRCQ